MSKINVTLYGKEGATQYEYAPATIAEQVSIAAEDGSASTVENEINTLRTKVNEILNNGVTFKGTVTQSAGLPTVSYKSGWQYSVAEAGTYAGQVCEVGDFILCIKDYASGSASDKDWIVLQVNIVGAVTGPESAVANRVAVFDGTSGKIIKDSGYTIAKSVPADAVFTDTIYNNATTTADGTMSAADKVKLNGIEAGADKTDATNVTAAGAVMKSGSSDDLPEGETNLYMTTDEKTKLSGLTEGAEPNQNAFSSVKVGNTTMTASSTTDTLTLTAGDGVTLTASAKNVTVSETYVDSCIVTSLDNIPTNLRNGGLIIVKS